MSKINVHDFEMFIDNMMYNFSKNWIEEYKLDRESWPYEMRLSEWMDHFISYIENSE